MIERHIVRLHLKIDKTSPAKYINKFDKKEKALIDSPGLANISTRSTVGLRAATASAKLPPKESPTR